MSCLMPASTPQNASQIKDVHDRTSSAGRSRTASLGIRYVLLPISPGRTNEGAGGGRGTGIQHSPSWGQRSQVPKLPWRAHVGPTRSVNLPDVRFTSNSYRALALQRNDATCRVEMWRVGCRLNISVAASFVWRCLSGSAMAPFPHPAHRTGQADFPPPALGQDFTPSPTTPRAQAVAGVRAPSARTGARVDTLPPCAACTCP